MAKTYATLAQWTTMIGCVNGLSDGAINDQWLPYGAMRVNVSLGKCFTLPFSNNNYTANQLSIQYGYLGFLQTRTRKKDDSDELAAALNQMVTDICSGNAPMVTDDGIAIPGTGAQFDAWSTTQDYEPTFNMLSPERQKINPDRLDDEYDAVHNTTGGLL